jgi:hypothetical protein
VGKGGCLENPSAMEFDLLRSADGRRPITVVDILPILTASQRTEYCHFVAVCQFPLGEIAAVRSFKLSARESLKY